MASQVTPLQLALRYLSSAPRSEAEVRQRLAKAGVDAELVDDTIDRLRNLNFVDDAVLARDWVESRMRTRGYGAARLNAELTRKGIPRDLRDAALDSIDPDTSMRAALTVARKRLQSDDIENPDTRRRIAQFLARRGYSWETIEQVFRTIASN